MSYFKKGEQVRITADNHPVKTGEDDVLRVKEVVEPPVIKLEITTPYSNESETAVVYDSEIESVE